MQTLFSIKGIAIFVEVKKVDYIIVGQGLAGSVLAYKLITKGKKVLVIDEEKESTSSRVAAGMCNPIVFKRLTKSWLIDEVLDQAKAFYHHQEKLLNDQFYFDVPIYKLFVDEQEQQFWKQKSNEPDLFDWLNYKIEKPFDETIDLLIEYVIEKRDEEHIKNGCLLAKFRQSRDKFGKKTQEQIDIILKERYLDFELWIKEAISKGEFNHPLSPKLVANYIISQLDYAVYALANGEKNNNIRHFLTLALSVLRKNIS